MTNKIIRVENLGKRFGDFQAVNDLNFELEAGKIYGIIGPNGAGKSTTMSLLMGLIFPTTGMGLIDGDPLGSKEAKSKMGYSPEFPSFYTKMTCIEYLVYQAMLMEMSEEEAYQRAISLIKEFNLEKHMFKYVQSFSTGMKKKVGLIQALIHHPKIVLLDEPTANLDPTSRNEIISTLKKLTKEEQMTVLISSHVLSELETIIDHVLMINHGCLVLNEDLQTMQKRFRNTDLLVESDHNEELKAYLLSKKQNVSLNQNQLIIQSEDKDSVSKMIVEACYKNNWQLILLQNQVVTLDSLYRQLVKGEKS